MAVVDNLQDKNGVQYDIAAKQFSGTRTLTLTGDIVGSVTDDFSGAVNISAGIADNAIDTATIADGAVTTSKVADQSITDAKLSTELQTAIGNAHSHSNKSKLDNYTNAGSSSTPVYVAADGTPTACTAADILAGKDDDGNVIRNTYATKTELNSRQDVIQSSLAEVVPVNVQGYFFVDCIDRHQTYIVKLEQNGSNSATFLYRSYWSGVGGFAKLTCLQSQNRDIVAYNEMYTPEGGSVNSSHRAYFKMPISASNSNWYFTVTKVGNSVYNYMPTPRYTTELPENATLIPCEYLQTEDNEVTSWSSTTSDKKYPSEKLVKDSLDLKANSSNVYTKTEVDSALTTKQDVLPTSGSASSTYAIDVSGTANKSKVLQNVSANDLNYDDNRNIQDVSVSVGDYCSAIILYDLTQFFDGTIVNNVNEQSSFVGQLNILRDNGSPNGLVVDVSSVRGYSSSSGSLYTNNNNFRPVIIKKKYEDIDKGSQSVGAWSGVVGGTATLDSTLTNSRYYKVSVTSGSSYYINNVNFSQSGKAAYIFVDDNNVIKGMASNARFDGFITAPNEATNLIVHCNTGDTSLKCIIGASTSNYKWYSAITCFSTIASKKMCLIGRFATRNSASGNISARPLLMNQIYSNAGTYNDSTLPAGYEIVRDAVHYMDASTADTATKATKDGNGNVITDKYVTLDTAQTITGYKVFTGGDSSSRSNVVVGDGSKASQVTCIGNAGTVSLISNNVSAGNNFVGVYYEKNGHAGYAVSVDNDGNINLNGLASKATADASGNTITTTYATKTEETNRNGVKIQGIGGSAADLNDLTLGSNGRDGWYYWSGSDSALISNRPNDTANYLHELRLSATYKEQFCYPSNCDNFFYKRSCNNGTWTEWTRCYTVPRKSNDVATFASDDAQAYTGKAIAEYVAGAIGGNVGGYMGECSKTDVASHTFKMGDWFVASEAGTYNYTVSGTAKSISGVAIGDELYFTTDNELEIKPTTAYEKTSNKVTTLDNSNTHYPSTSAVKTYVDTGIGNLSNTYETITNVANKSSLKARLLTSSDDVNDTSLLSGANVGYFTWQYNSVPANVPNANLNGFMEFRKPNTGSHYVQIAYYEGSDSYYYRIGTNSGWQSWKQVYYEATSTYSSTGTQAVNGTAVASAIANKANSKTISLGANNYTFKISNGTLVRTYIISINSTIGVGSCIYLVRLYGSGTNDRTKITLLQSSGVTASFKTNSTSASSNDLYVTIGTYASTTKYVSVTGLDNAIPPEIVEYTDAIPQTAESISVVGSILDGNGNKIVDTYATKTEVDAKADDSEVVHIAGNETITGSKVFSSIVSINTGNTATNASLNLTGAAGNMNIMSQGSSGSNRRGIYFGAHGTGGNKWGIYADENNNVFVDGLTSKATADASGNTITSTYATKSELTSGLNGKQDSLPTTGSASNTYAVNISGNAATATKATQDASGNTITTYYAKQADMSATYVAATRTLRFDGLTFN